ncbi:Sodium-and chloride-dependent glycine transporter 2 [Aphelenchoides besseyi]|nr:Sodium-and chloride-dependent glycine transporter 2 [Aphelenchoides besseyi]
MSRIHSLQAESLAASSTFETDETLLTQLDQLEKRSDIQRKYDSVRDRVKAVDVLIQKCRQLVGTDEVSAALLYVRCLSLVEETDKIISGRMSVVSTANSQTSSFYRIQPANTSKTISTHKNIWSTADLVHATAVSNPLAQQQRSAVEDDERFQYGYYGYYKSKWWRFLCMNSAKEAKDKNTEIRDLWNTQIEFFLSCLGFIVGVGNTLRFPSMIYQYGGIFFIPYVISLGVFGFPLVYMHLSIGQYSGLSASGIGWALVLLAVPVSIYYNIIVAWSLYYLWFSIQGAFLDDGLPWSHCNQNWKSHFHCCELTPVSLMSQNLSDCYSNPRSLTAPEAFFHYEVLNRTFISEPYLGDVQVHMVVSLAIAWCLVFFGVFKGIGSIGWAVSFTATVPYFMAFVLLLRGLSLTGAGAGMNSFLHLDFRKLWSINIWKSAAEQVFYELGIDAGPLISMASFSRYRNNIYRDALLLVLINSFTSILCATVIFTFVGFLATAQEKQLNEILKHDSLYLAFTVYPGVTVFMDWGWLWAALFFGMLTLSAIDAEFAWLEMIASSIMNQLGSKNKTVETRLLVGLCLGCFLCGLPLCARGGIYIFHSIENLNANWNSFSLSLMTVFVVCYIHGVENFIEGLREMLRIEPAPTQWSAPGKSRWYIFYKRLKYCFGPTGDYIKLSWCVFSPFILTTLLLSSIFNYERVRFNDKVLPWPYEAIAWIAMIGPLFVVPFTVTYTIYETWKRKKPLLSVVSGKNWRNKKVEPVQEHKIDLESEYIYIDPISRGASAKSRGNDSAVNPNHMTNEDSYSRATDRIREWAQRSSKNEPVQSIDVTIRNIPSIVTADYEEKTDRIEEGDEASELEEYGRRPGRIRDLMFAETIKSTTPRRSPIQRSTVSRSPSNSSSSKSNKYAEEEEQNDPLDDSKDNRRPTVKRSPMNAESLNLFGPPPVSSAESPFEQSMTLRINKHRANRRSDQRRNRMFNDGFNLVVMDANQPSGSSGGTSTDRKTPSPSASAPDRPDTTQSRHQRLTARPSTASNLSRSPFDVGSVSTTSTDFREPVRAPLPRLKRPKPIGSIPPATNDFSRDNSMI